MIKVYKKNKIKRKFKKKQKSKIYTIVNNVYFKKKLKQVK